MDMGNNSGIGFKIFGLFALIVGAIILDIIIFSDGVDLSGFTDLLDEMFYTYDEDDEWLYDCDYSFTYLGNEQYSLWNKNDISSMVYKVNALADRFYDYTGTFPDEPEGIKYTYKVEYCGNSIQFNDKMDYIRFDDGNGIAIYEGSDYIEYLNEIRDYGVVTDLSVHFYEDEYFQDETEFYEKEISYEDNNRIVELWNQSKTNIVEWPFETDASYMLVIAGDFIVFDNFGGRVYYNGNSVEVPKEMMDILWKYI